MRCRGIGGFTSPRGTRSSIRSCRRAADVAIERRAQQEHPQPQKCQEHQKYPAVKPAAAKPAALKPAELKPAELKPARQCRLRIRRNRVHTVFIHDHATRSRGLHGAHTHEPAGHATQKSPGEDRPRQPWLRGTLCPPATKLSIIQLASAPVATATTPTPYSMTTTAITLPIPVTG